MFGGARKIEASARRRYVFVPTLYSKKKLTGEESKKKNKAILGEKERKACL